MTSTALLNYFFTQLVLALECIKADACPLQVKKRWGWLRLILCVSFSNWTLLGGRKDIRPIKDHATYPQSFGPMWARGHCRISPPRFLAECCKRQLNQVSLVLLYFRLSAFSDLYWVCFSVFSYTVLFVSISQVIGCEDCLRNDLYCVGWGVKLYSNQNSKFCSGASGGKLMVTDK